MMEEEDRNRRLKKEEVSDTTADVFNCGQRSAKELIMCPAAARCTHIFKRGKVTWGRILTVIGVRTAMRKKLRQHTNWNKLRRGSVLSILPPRNLDLKTAERRVIFSSIVIYKSREINLFASNVLYSVTGKMPFWNRGDEKRQGRKEPRGRAGERKIRWAAGVKHRSLSWADKSRLGSRSMRWRTDTASGLHLSPHTWNPKMTGTFTKTYKHILLEGKCVLLH